MTLQEIVSRFPTTPFIFAGSGITRRYYDLPDWSSLLLHFAKIVKGGDAFSLRYYENLLDEGITQKDKMPTIASLIEKDFNALWLSNGSKIRSSDPLVIEQIEAGVSPFKAEIAAYLRSKSALKEAYTGEVEKLRRISKSNVSGIITTNYDSFFEHICDGYKVYVGQDELVFSQIQGVAEIYKIHGSIEAPNSIVINREDYQLFNDKSKYLAAKLMTIFMEYPIIFMGYSLSDPDVLSILEDIVACLPEEKVSVLGERFVFVEYDRDKKESVITSHSIVVHERVINMTKIVTSDFAEIYDALAVKKAAFPVKILRRFKDDLYTFALTSESRTTMRVADLGDERIDENTLALTIGLASTGKYGLARAVDAEKWYRNIILQDLNYSADDMLELVYPELAKQNSGKLPVWYYIQNLSNQQIGNMAKEKGAACYQAIVSEDSVKRNRTATNGRSALQIWNDEKDNQRKAIRLIGVLPEEKVDVGELEMILNELFQQDENVLSALVGPDRSNLKRLIRIYDFLKYKTP